MSSVFSCINEKFHIELWTKTQTLNKPYIYSHAKHECKPMYIEAYVYISRHYSIQEDDFNSLSTGNLMSRVSWKLVHIGSGPLFCLLLGVSSDYAQPITRQVTEVTCPAIGRAQPELTLSKRQKTGPGEDFLPGDSKSLSDHSLNYH